MNFIGVLKKIGHGAEVVGKDALAVAGPAVSVAAEIDPALEYFPFGTVGRQTARNRNR